MSTSTLVLYCTCPDRECAGRIADTLLEQKLAACITLLPSVTSIYLWQGKRESSQETLLLIKTRESRYKEVETAILSLHPYELPEIIAVPVTRGLPGYLDWVDQCTKKPA